MEQRSGEAGEEVQDHAGVKGPDLPPDSRRRGELLVPSRLSLYHTETSFSLNATLYPARARMRRGYILYIPMWMYYGIASFATGNETRVMVRYGGKGSFMTGKRAREAPTVSPLHFLLPLTFMSGVVRRRTLGGLRRKKLRFFLFPSFLFTEKICQNTKTIAKCIFFYCSYCMKFPVYLAANPKSGEGKIYTDTLINKKKK